MRPIYSSNIKTLLIVFFLMIAGVLYTLYRKRKIQKLREKIFERDDLSLDVFFDSYYKNTEITKVTVAKIVNNVAEFFEIPSGKLRPTDVFGRELVQIPGWLYEKKCSALFEPLISLEDENFFEDNENIEGGVDIVTLDDLIKLISSLKKS